GTGVQTCALPIWCRRRAPRGTPPAPPRCCSSPDPTPPARGERMTTDRPCLPQRTTAARLIVVIRGEQATQYAPVLETLAGAGIRSVELTLSTPGTLEQLPGLLERFGDQLDIGIGTVTDPSDLR